MSYNEFGLRVPDRRDGAVLAEIADMLSPVRCASCRGVYDLGNVTATGQVKR